MHDYKNKFKFVKTYYITQRSSNNFFFDNSSTET